MLPFLLASCSGSPIVEHYESPLCFNNESITIFLGKTYELSFSKSNKVSLNDIELLVSDDSMLIINDDLTITPIKVGKVILTIRLKSQPDVYDWLEIIIEDYPLANGIYNFSDIGNNKNESFKLYGSLEKYIINNHLLGVPLYGFRDPYRQKYFSSDLFNFAKLYVNGCSNEIRNIVFDNDGFDGMPEFLSQRLPYFTKPILQNTNFYDGLIACINREELASKNHKKGETIAQLVSFDRYNLVPIGYDYTSSEYDYEAIGKLDNYSLLDYIKTDYYKDNFKGILNGTDEYGYSFEKAHRLFVTATNELISQGLYSTGDNIELNILVSNSDLNFFPIEDLNLIKSYIESAFNYSNEQLHLTINIETTAFSVELLSLYGAFDIAMCLYSQYDIDDFKAFSTFKYSDVCQNALSLFNTFGDQYCNDNYSPNQTEISFKGERFTFSAISHALNYARGDTFDTGTIVKDGLLYTLKIA